MKRKFLAAALFACAVAPAIAEDLYYAPAASVTVGMRQGYVHQEPATIQAVQYRLLARGYTVPIDGVFDQYTAEALKHFQNLQGFVPSGVIDQPTLTVLGIPEAMPATIR